MRDDLVTEMRPWIDTSHVWKVLLLRSQLKPEQQWHARTALALIEYMDTAAVTVDLVECCALRQDRSSSDSYHPLMQMSNQDPFKDADVAARPWQSYSDHATNSCDQNKAAARLWNHGIWLPWAAEQMEFQEDGQDCGAAAKERIHPLQDGKRFTLRSGKRHCFIVADTSMQMRIMEFRAWSEASVWERNFNIHHAAMTSLGWESYKDCP